MAKQNIDLNSDSDLELLERELYREKYKSRYKKVLRSTIYALVIVAAISTLIATLFLPVLQIYGDSMDPTLKEGDIVVSIKDGNYKVGSVCAFYNNNHILVKRIIATSGQMVDIDDDGNVYVDEKMIDEPYITKKYKGETDLDYPFQVPDDSYFVMGDHRETSMDSRMTDIGCIKKDDIVGKIVLTVWPLSEFGLT